jgi:hypothetical protein
MRSHSALNPPLYVWGNHVQKITCSDDEKNCVKLNNLIIFNANRLWN